MPLSYDMWMLKELMLLLFPC